LAGVTLSLTIPRRRVWVAVRDGELQVAALARGDDPALERVVAEITAELTMAEAPSGTAAGGSSTEGKTND